jgi:hypothetical protein
MRLAIRLRDWVPHLPLASYCLLAGFAALFGSALLVLAARLAADALGLPLQFVAGASIATDLGNVVAVVLVAPVLETALLVALLWLLRRLGCAAPAACTASALL